MSSESGQGLPAARLVTVAIPVSTRLQYLPNALACVGSQDYEHLELIVSDNGMNGDVVPELVARHYHRPFTFRQNLRPVPIVEHFNQLLDAASGEYFVLLCDDDEISPTFVSELAGRLDRTATAHVALARPETVDAVDGQRRTFDGYWPAQLPADEFIRAWAVKRLRLVSTVTHMSRTTSARLCGGHAELPRALYSDNLLLLKLALMGDVVFGQGCTFTWRIDDASTGFSATCAEVARACRDFMRSLDRDRHVMAYARQHRGWSELRLLLRQQCGNWYFHRWRDRYRRRLSRAEWIRAAFALPFVPSYYRDVVMTLTERCKRHVERRAPVIAAMKRRVTVRRQQGPRAL
jgi:glycosyltransferase involved in cell wall biosynthesis